MSQFVWLPWIPDPLSLARSLCTAIKLAASVTFDKRKKRKVMCVHAHLGDDPTEKRTAQWNVWFNLSQESADAVDWNLCESDFSEPMMRLPSFTRLSVFTPVASRRNLR